MAWRIATPTKTLGWLRVPHSWPRHTSPGHYIPGSRAPLPIGSAHAASFRYAQLILPRIQVYQKSADTISVARPGQFFSGLGEIGEGVDVELTSTISSRVCGTTILFPESGPGLLSRLHISLPPPVPTHEPG